MDSIQHAPLGVDEAERKLVEAIIRAYHTTRLNSDFGPHILHKPQVREALDAVRCPQSPAPNTTAQGDEALVERDRIVAWLRTMQDYRWRLKLEADTGEIEILQGAMSQAYQNAADAIERGDHRAALKSGSAKP